jgi:antitoxin HigA-1
MIMLSKNRQPTHPGEILSEEFLNPLQISQGNFAKHLGGSWTQSKVNQIINKKRRVTEAIALDLADALSTTPEFWLNLQYRYDLWFALRAHRSIPLLPKMAEFEHPNYDLSERTLKN